jgi:hypothetical protein
MLGFDQALDELVRKIDNIGSEAPEKGHQKDFTKKASDQEFSED